MNAKTTGDEAIVQAADLLEQIKSVDEMLTLHRERVPADEFMLGQYRHRRQRLLTALNEALAILNLTISDAA